MNEKFFSVALAVIIIPYGLMFLMLLWNVIGPVIRARLMRGAEGEDITSRN